MKKKSYLWQGVQVALFAVLLACGYSCSGVSSSEDDTGKFSYLPVQMEKDGNWSIIDGNGTVVVKDEYPADNAVWLPTKNGAYWVKANDKFSLYSVESPKKPLMSVEYDNVTDFNDGRAFVSVFGEPIQMIDESGKVVKTLPEDVTMVWNISDGMAAYLSKKSGLYGFLNLDAEVAVKPYFTNLVHFGEGYAAGQDEAKNWKVVDKKGKIVEDWGKSRYFCANTYSDGVFLAVDTAEWTSVCYLDKKGEVAVRPAKKARLFPGRNVQKFYQGKAIVFDENQAPGLIDKNGEFLIRFGKYKSLNRLGGDFFSATNSNGNTGVIDKDENIIIPFNYSDWGGLMLGDNFLLKQGGYYVLVDQNGEELKNCEYANFSICNNSFVTFVNIKANINAVVDLFTPKGYQPLGGKTDMPSIANIYDLNLESFPTYTRYFTTNVTAGDWSATAELWFDDAVKTELYHTEVQNDGWFSNEVEVSDGYGWNKGAILEEVRFDLTTESSVNIEDLKDRVRKKFIEKGFKEVGSKLYGRNGDKTPSLYLTSDINGLKIYYKFNDTME